jgi:hypothetical protein
MKEIVWVLGHSGVGKETFCRYLSESPKSKLIEQLGWTGMRIGLCESSIALIPRGHCEQKQDNRDKIIDEINDKFDSLEVVLIKWQAQDTQTGRIRAVSTAFHELVTRAIILEAHDSRVQERHTIRNSEWQPVNGWQDFLKHERTIINKALSDFEIVDRIDTNHDYRLLA